MKNEISRTDEPRPLTKHNVSGSCYRIVTDRYCGYEVQIKKTFLFWTWWSQVNFTNTHTTIQEAKKYIEAKKKDHEASVVWVSSNCR